MVNDVAPAQSPNDALMARRRHLESDKALRLRKILHSRRDNIDLRDAFRHKRSGCSIRSTRADVVAVHPHDEFAETAGEPSIHGFGQAPIARQPHERRGDCSSGDEVSDHVFLVRADRSVDHKDELIRQHRLRLDAARGKSSRLEAVSEWYVDINVLIFGSPLRVGSRDSSVDAGSEFIARPASISPRQECAGGSADRRGELQCRTYCSSSRTLTS